ncbi:MAG: hypothetical protein OEW15_07770 [Nitrospirota bacterium]|nr:hypothetical protein [Nitrospirota bacterium]
MEKHHTLKILAAALWFSGGIVLMTKGSLLLAAGKYAFLLGVAVLDWSIAVALIGSGHIYRTRQ